MKNAIGIKLYTYDDYKTDESAYLVFEITNLTKNTLHILKWNTPLEGLHSPCLDITKGRKHLEYDGVMKKRGTPQATDFITLKAGESISNKVDLWEAYDISTPGGFKVNFKPEKFIYFTDLPIENAIEMSSLGTPPKKKEKINLDIKPTSFHVEASKGKKMTPGALHRLEELKKKKKIDTSFHLMATPDVLPCLLIGGTSKQKTKARAAHKNGYAIAKKAFENLANDAKYNLWFGKYAKSRLHKVRSNFEKIIHQMETSTFTYDLNKSGCGSSDYAYTYKGTKTIWFCDAFWAAPDKGPNSRAGTVVHEHTHASAFIDDIIYSEPGCKQLAIDNPAKAVVNADSHEYYAEY